RDGAAVLVAWKVTLFADRLEPKSIAIDRWISEFLARPLTMRREDNKPTRGGMLRQRKKPTSPSRRRQMRKKRQGKYHVETLVEIEQLRHLVGALRGYLNRVLQEIDRFR